eukprot:jgi/Tetstr1/423588/TSEL_014260.t1
MESVKASADLAEYEVTLRHDSMAPRYRLWFWFTVNNATPGQRAIISVVNFSKTKSLYRHGMTPIADDEYEFAYTYPYTYTHLQRQLASYDRMALPFCRRELLCGLHKCGEWTSSLYATPRAPEAQALRREATWVVVPMLNLMDASWALPAGLAVAHTEEGFLMMGRQLAQAMFDFYKLQKPSAQSQRPGARSSARGRGSEDACHGEACCRVA